MKLMYGNVPIKSLNIKYYELDTNSCDMVASDLQAGKTAVAKGRKIVGTGKSFEFANYGKIETNISTYVPSDINIIELSSLDYPIKLTAELTSLKNLDFSTNQTIATVVVNGVEHNLNVSVNSNLLTINCDQNFFLQVFYGKDNYT